MGWSSETTERTMAEVIGESRGLRHASMSIDSLITGKSLPFPSLFIEQNSNPFVSRFAAENKCELIMKGVAHICMANQLTWLL